MCSFYPFSELIPLWPVADMSVNSLVKNSFWQVPEIQYEHIPGCTQSGYWRPASPHWSPWKSYAALARQWHPSQNSTNRNHWLTPAGERHSSTLEYIHLFVLVHVCVCVCSHLDPKQVIHSRDDDVDCGVVSCLSPQIVLEVWNIIQ